MPERLTYLILFLAIHFVVCTTPGVDDEEDNDPEFRGFEEYETWKPPMHHSPPEVIVIKHKEPHVDSMHPISSAIKHHLPLLAVIAPLVAVCILLPLKAYFGPSYLVYPPVPAAPPAAPPSMRDRVGKVEDEGFEEHQNLAAHLLSMIEEIDKFYGEMTDKDKDA